MTYKEKLSELQKESLFTQKHFLAINNEIRYIASKKDTLPEELLFQRDKLYHQFNKILKAKRRIVNYATDKNLQMDSNLKEGITKGNKKPGD